MLIFCCRLCAVFLVQLLLQMLILPTVPSDTFSSSYCLLSVVPCSYPGHLPQHVHVFLLWLPNSVCFSASHSFLCFPLPSGKGLRLTGLKSQVPSRFLIWFPLSSPALSGFSLGAVSTVWFSLSSCYSLLCWLCLF